MERIIFNTWHEVFSRIHLRTYESVRAKVQRATQIPISNIVDNQIWMDILDEIEFDYEKP